MRNMLNMFEEFARRARSRAKTFTPWYGPSPCSRWQRGHSAGRRDHPESGRRSAFGEEAVASRRAPDPWHVGSMREEALSSNRIDSEPRGIAAIGAQVAPEAFLVWRNPRPAHRKTNFFVGPRCGTQHHHIFAPEGFF